MKTGHGLHAHVNTQHTSTRTCLKFPRGAETHLLWDRFTTLLLDHASGQDSPAPPFAHLRRDKLTSIRLGSPCFMTHQSRGTLTHPFWHHHTATASLPSPPLLCGRSKVCRGTPACQPCPNNAASFLPPPPLRQHQQPL